MGTFSSKYLHIIKHTCISEVKKSDLLGMCLLANTLISKLLMIEWPLELNR